MVQSWYQGGISIFDFTDSANPVEIAFFDRGPLNAENPVMGGYWSSYWYNGYIYGTAIQRGVAVLELTPSRHLSQNEIDAATQVELGEFNPQNQNLFEWSPPPAVALSYVDQLSRRNSIRPAHATSVRDALNRLDADAAAVDELQELAVELNNDANLLPAGASRLRSLANTLTELAGEQQ